MLKALWGAGASIVKTAVNTAIAAHVTAEAQPILTRLGITEDALSRYDKKIDWVNSANHETFANFSVDRETAFIAELETAIRKLEQLETSSTVTPLAKDFLSHTRSLLFNLKRSLALLVMVKNVSMGEDTQLEKQLVILSPITSLKNALLILKDANYLPRPTPNEINDILSAHRGVLPPVVYTTLKEYAINELERQVSADSTSKAITLSPDHTRVQIEPCAAITVLNTLYKGNNEAIRRINSLNMLATPLQRNTVHSLNTFLSDFAKFSAMTDKGEEEKLRYFSDAIHTLSNLVDKFTDQGNTVINLQLIALLHAIQRLISKAELSITIKENGTDLFLNYFVTFASNEQRNAMPVTNFAHILQLDPCCGLQKFATKQIAKLITNELCTRIQNSAVKTEFTRYELNEAQSAKRDLTVMIQQETLRLDGDDQESVEKFFTILYEVDPATHRACKTQYNQALQAAAEVKSLAHIKEKNNALDIEITANKNKLKTFEKIYEALRVGETGHLKSTFPFNFTRKTVSAPIVTFQYPATLSQALTTTMNQYVTNLNLLAFQKACIDQIQKYCSAKSESRSADAWRLAERNLSHHALAAEVHKISFKNSGPLATAHVSGKTVFFKKDYPTDASFDLPPKDGSRMADILKALDGDVSAQNNQGPQS